VTDITDQPALQKGITPEGDISKIALKEGMICEKGYLKIPKDGTYQFTMNGNGSYLFKLHDAMVIDRSYPDQPKLRMATSSIVYLKAGYHPFRIYFHKTGNGKPNLDWTWQSQDIEEQPVPAEALFHAEE
jgi:hypothetical protein